MFHERIWHILQVTNWHRRPLWFVLTLLLAETAASLAIGADEPQPVRRVLDNFDGDSCLATKAGGKGPATVNVDDVNRLIEEVAYEGSRVDTVLVCVNAQVMYYPPRSLRKEEGM